MKKTIMSLAVISALLSSSAMAALTAGQADNSASTATLNFSGKVTSSLCQINTSDLNKMIQLGNASVTDLNADGQSPFMTFNIGLVNCDPSVSNISYVISDANSSPDAGNTTEYLIPKSTSTSAAGVGVYITDPQHKAIGIGENKTLKVINGSDGGALSEQNISLTAYMKKAGSATVTAGTVDATGVMTIKAAAE
ncbi:type 1 fimbrial protein [Escherichia coli]|uniref:fimbrial protein n=1 Tax=Escherichia albertii TaxID=208962 RepID=UPI0007434C35|nr:fimbrial protein [Escherichia albertii]EIO6660685.1 type 1 fimbrial protein [Escherichia coli]HAX3258561.1 type 1 fimbrial protein [Escherichia albertii]